MQADVRELGDELKRRTLMCFHAGIDSVVRNYALHGSTRTFIFQLFAVLGVQHKDTVLRAAESCERSREGKGEATCERRRCEGRRRCATRRRR